MSGGNGSVFWSTGRLAYCVLWLDQETEDKVAVGLIAIEQLRRSSSNYYYIQPDGRLAFEIEVGG